MKIKTFLCTFMVMLMSLASCAQKKGTEMTETKDNKVLVAYFSATGHTRSVAKTLAEVMGATLHEITPEKPYTSEDFSWTDTTTRSYVENHKLGYRPPISDKVENMAHYDTVFIGYPLWWDLAPTIINTFIENNDFEGKTVVCFATSGGSPIAASVDTLKKQYPNINWVDGKRLNDFSREDMINWKKELGM